MALHPPPALRRALDRVIVSVARLVSRLWFRSVETRGLDRIADDRPVIVAANHANGFVDPVLVIAMSPRPLHFLAKATLWKVPGVGFLLEAAGVLPVRRRQDGATAGNDTTFDDCHRILVSDGAIGIFPEGAVSDAPRLRPVRTGAARIAIGAREKGARALRIVPVGLVYMDKATPRTRVLVRAATPIDLDQVLPQLAPHGPWTADNAELVDALTDLLATRLAQASLDYDDPDHLVALALAASVYVRTPDADPGHALSIDRVESITRQLSRAPEILQQNVLQLSATYDEALRVVKLEDRDVVPGNTSARVAARTQQSAGTVAALAVPGAVGAVLNALPFLVMRAARRKPMTRVSRANFTLLVSLVAFPLTWVGWALVARARGLRHPWRTALVAGPACGHAAVAGWEQLRSLRRSKLQWRRTQDHASVLADLRTEREDLVAAIDQALAGSSEASAA